MFGDGLQKFLYKALPARAENRARGHEDLFRGTFCATCRMVRFIPGGFDHGGREPALDRGRLAQYRRS